MTWKTITSELGFPTFFNETKTLSKTVCMNLILHLQVSNANAWPKREYTYLPNTGLSENLKIRGALCVEVEFYADISCGSKCGIEINV